MCVSEEIKRRIDTMSREEILRKIRFGQSSDELFLGDNYTYLLKRYNDLGGTTPDLSKKVGW